ncbi:hypothetical protein PRZ48_006728 [Zasmidium cellare]|uniref:Gfo/Idh/MocA-like oxidoreductase N-terminal domain-containing protein n=1 Tax=Zasmidium cellare TaxID=395010 RepID=A0ABR0EP82_ZASCE|nr:hypothetical protein PRZ48_006728 [Zasmidium cellare]
MLGHPGHLRPDIDSEMTEMTGQGKQAVRIYRDTAPSLPSDAENYGVAHFSTIQECLDAYKSGELGFEAIIMATPTQTHVSMAQLFENSGLAVLIEKPLSTNGQDGKSLLALSNRDTQSVYMVGHHRRHSPYVKAVKQVMDSKKLGDIVAANGGE